MSTHPVKLERHLHADEVPSLDDLAATANREHGLCESAGRSALMHSLAAGTALLAAREQVAPGQWFVWLRANFDGAPRTATAHMRFATHREHLTPDMTFAEAQSACAGRPDVRPRGGPVQYPDDLRREVVGLVKDGKVTQREAAEQFGVSQPVISTWLDPARRRRQNAQSRKRRFQARAALAKVEREKAIRSAVRKAGAALSEAYSMAEAMQDVLAQAEREAGSAEARAAIQEAQRHHHKTRDEIVRALGVA